MKFWKIIFFDFILIIAKFNMQIFIEIFDCVLFILFQILNVVILFYIVIYLKEKKCSRKFIVGNLNHFKNYNFFNMVFIFYFLFFILIIFY